MCIWVPYSVVFLRRRLILRGRLLLASGRAVRTSCRLYQTCLLVCMSHSLYVVHVLFLLVGNMFLPRLLGDIYAAGFHLAPLPALYLRAEHLIGLVPAMPGCYSMAGIIWMLQAIRPISTTAGAQSWTWL